MVDNQNAWASLKDPTMEVEWITIESISRGRLTTSNGCKFNYVISGSCEYAVKNNTIVVEESDSHYFDALALYIAAGASRRSGVSIHSILPKNSRVNTTSIKKLSGV